MINRYTNLSDDESRNLLHISATFESIIPECTVTAFERATTIEEFTEVVSEIATFMQIYSKFPTILAHVITPQYKSVA